MRHDCSFCTRAANSSLPVFSVSLAVRQDPLLGANEMFNSFLRKAQQVGVFAGIFCTRVAALALRCVNVVQPPEPDVVL